ncbi:unnamed protein product [Gulo gulo]|uniref:Uncharacterized protein n=1 Tax=Gulo gulo TaxID=48420 RepID=A0A9X9LU87_GULGU|nr:unnamed protein product [Gulo gulo]
MSLKKHLGENTTSLWKLESNELQMNESSIFFMEKLKSCFKLCLC